MPYVTTLIAPQQAPFFDDAPLAALKNAGITVDERRSIARDRAVDAVSAAAPSAALLDDLRARFGIDVVTQDAGTREKRLFIADMDATMVAEETLDELAAHAGLRDHIAAITARAMNGELDFAAAVRERVGLLRGLPLTALEETAEKITCTPGGKRLLETLHAHGVHCVLVSGGFTFFTGKVAQTLGFDEHHGNVLDVAQAALTGTVREPILDKNFKKQCLESTLARLGAGPEQAVAIGDGANDLPMLQAAGLGIGWRSKKVLRDALPNHLLVSDLDALVWILGLEA